MPQGGTVFFPMTDYWMGRLIDGRRVEVRARTAHWARLIPGRRYARFQVGNFRGPQVLFIGRLRAKSTITSVLKSTFVDSL